MTWNYRIVRYADGKGYGLHEVYYDENGKPNGMTKDPINFTCDDKEGPVGIKGSLARAFDDAKHRPVLDEAETWPKGVKNG